MSVQAATLKISDQEFKDRCERLAAHIVEQQVSGALLFDRDYILYYAGFHFIPTERPIAFLMNAAGETGMFVPRLETAHAQSMATVDQVADYVEYPGDPHPMSVLATLLSDMGIADAVLADSDGYPWIFGYQGPALSEMGMTVHTIRPFIEQQMAIKSEAEIALLRESCKWANLAHMLLQRYTRVGLTETEVSMRAGQEATLAMMDAIGPIYRAQSGLLATGAVASYRGQIGRGSAIPHALANNVTFQAGDVLVTGATAPVWGYLSELERTMFVGPASDLQRRMFDHMVALQDLALAAIEPGKPCADVDKEVRAYYREHDLFSYWRHHTGHTIGLRYHEGPFLDIGDQTIIKPGMVFTVEPGLYASALGGFRHSDTVVVREDGVESLTFYPRDLASLTIPLQ